MRAINTYGHIEQLQVIGIAAGGQDTQDNECMYYHVSAKEVCVTH